MKSFKLYSDFGWTTLLRFVGGQRWVPTVGGGCSDWRWVEASATAVVELLLRSGLVIGKKSTPKKYTLWKTEMSEQKRYSATGIWTSKSFGGV
jgi:hypothetical protein